MASQPSIVRNSLAEQTYELLRRQIIEGTLRPGERLSIFDLSAQLGISRTPVKEAINRLSLDGLVTILPQSGTFVSRLTTEQIREIYEARLMIELWAVPQIALPGRDWDSAAAAALLDHCSRLFRNENEFDLATFVDCDRDFHKLIVKAARNERISALYESVYPQIQLLRVYWASPDRCWKSHGEHGEIFAAIERGDQEKIQQSLRDHIIGSGEDVIRLLTLNRPPLVAEAEILGADSAGEY
jgi:DNA-binding GntR family transcriptional regulator